MACDIVIYFVHCPHSAIRLFMIILKITGKFYESSPQIFHHNDSTRYIYLIIYIIFSDISE